MFGLRYTSRRRLGWRRDVRAEAEDRDRVAVREPELEVAAGGDGDVLLAADRVADRRCVHARAEVEVPQVLPGLRVDRVEPAVALAEEREVARRRERAADQRLLGNHRPRDLAGLGVDRDEAPVLHAVRLDVAERAA